MTTKKTTPEGVEDPSKSKLLQPTYTIGFRIGLKSLYIIRQSLYWFPAVLWMFIIWGFSAQPSLRISDTNWADFIVRKTAHFIEYFILFHLYIYALQKTTHISKSKILLFSLIFAIIYAITDEFHQLSVYGREGRVRDVVIDSFGALSGWLLARR
mgnify:CR=1 FL=1